jgi:hypothetical protein
MFGGIGAGIALVPVCRVFAIGPMCVLPQLRRSASPAVRRALYRCRMARVYARLWVGVAVIALSALRVAAQPPEAADARPWAAGVSDAEQAIALELYVAGNHEFTESHFAQALAKYREALQHWDHPAIRYNMAVCLINLDQPVEARGHLERGLAYGAAPLGNEQYAQGLTYRKLLDAQLVRMNIVCAEAGAEVRLDGKLVLTGPGATDAFLLPGPHQVVATKRGLLTASRTFAHAAGERATLEIEPTLEPPLETRTVRRWATWKPWAVIASAAVPVGIGGLVYLNARSNLAAYDRGNAIACPHGCDKDMHAKLTDLNHTLSFVNTEQVIFGTLFAVGGAAVVTGVIGLILNQPRIQVAPAPSAIGATVSMRWEL